MNCPLECFESNPTFGVCKRGAMRPLPVFPASYIFSLLTISIAPMRALTPARRSLRPAGLPAYCVLPSCHSIPKHPMQPNHRFDSQVSVIRGFQASP